MKLTPRAEKILSLQRWILLFSLTLSSGLAAGFLKFILNVEGFLFWVSFFTLTYIAAKIIFNTVLFFTVMKIYDGNIEEMGKEAEIMKWVDPETDVQPNAEVKMTVVAVPDTPIGHYLDAEIFEWIEFTLEGKNVIAKFVDTISPKQLQTFVVPEEHALFPPGILYKLEPKQVEAESK